MMKTKTKKQTRAQVERQALRGAGGQYSKNSRCYGCGKAAPMEYFSHRLTDSVGADGVPFHDILLVLCAKCAKSTSTMNTVKEVEEYQRMAFKVGETK